MLNNGSAEAQQLLQGTSLPPPGPQQAPVVPSSLPYAVLTCSNKGKIIPERSIILEQAEQTEAKQMRTPGNLLSYL